jgi:hypothetical protein
MALKGQQSKTNMRERHTHTHTERERHTHTEGESKGLFEIEALTEKRINAAAMNCTS